jgi:PadR family transcriptional regulator PadR
MDSMMWKAQLRKGAAELVVLAVLERGEAYGPSILEQVCRTGDLVTEGALYPLLNRLERDGKLVARWELSGPASRPRKYYQLSAEGTRLLAEMRELWTEFHSAVSRIVEDGHGSR